MPGSVGFDPTSDSVDFLGTTADGQPDHDGGPSLKTGVGWVFGHDGLDRSRGAGHSIHRGYIERGASGPGSAMKSLLWIAACLCGPQASMQQGSQAVAVAPAAAASAELDIAYAELDSKQTLDLYLPAKKPFATVVFVYGGGWHAGSGKSCTPIAKHLQQAGYACALVSHRLTPPDVFPAHIEDLASAFAWVKTNIASRKGDVERVFLVGHSSGAHLSLLLASDPQYLAVHDLSPKDIAGVVGMSSPVDLEPRASGDGYGDALMGGKGADAFARDVALMRAASPLQHVSRELPPTWLVVGEHDFPMLDGDARAFAARGKELGIEIRVDVAHARDHMGVVASLLDDDDAIWKGLLDFLARPVTERGAARK